MMHSNWRRGAFVVAAVSVAAAGAWFVQAPARNPDAVDAAGLSGPGLPASTGPDGSRSVGQGGGAAATARHASAPPIPEGLPPVDPVDPPEYATGLAPDTLYAPDP